MNAPASQSNETSRQPSAITCQLALLAAHAPISRRVHHAGEHIYHAVDAFDRLYVVGAGLCKTIEVSRDGREQVVAVHFKGDWMGLGPDGCGLSESALFDSQGMIGRATQSLAIRLRPS